MTYLKNITPFWIKSVLISKRVDSKSVYNKKFLKTKIKSYDDEVTDFYDKEILKAGSHTCFAVIND